MTRLRAGSPDGGTTSGSPPSGNADAPSGSPPAEVSPDDAPRTCSACSEPLSLGERMFYFLEGAGSHPVCRDCLARQEAEAAPDASFWSELRGLEMASRSGGGGAESGFQGSNDLARAVRSLLIEELDRVDVVLERMPEREPDLPLLRNLEEETRQELQTGQLSAALVALRDLRRILSGRESARVHPPLSAPWDESVEELFDRVMARSHAMIRRPLPPEEPVEAADLVPVSGQYRSTGASS